MSISNLVSSALGFQSSFWAQQRTNGASVLGIVGAPGLAKFVDDAPTQAEIFRATAEMFPWGSRTAFNTNPYSGAPNTGIVRSYNFTLSRMDIAPDGYTRNAILVNGGFPGPMIEANWGDQIEVTVTNALSEPEEGTSLHWHGLLQKGTPYYDGVPSVHQCPIAPGETFTYNFQASLFGTSWYHSHYSSQYAGGLWGPMIIHGPVDNAPPYDIDIGPIALSDYYHEDYFTILKRVVSNASDADPAPRSDNNLINGKGTFDCSKAPDDVDCFDAPPAQFVFQTGMTHRLRLINTGAEGMQRFSIDGHTMTVMANDYVALEPYNTTVVTLGIGQRTDVLVTADQGDATSSFWMRSNISTICSLANQPYALAAVFYDQADQTVMPTSDAWDVPDPGTCANDDLEDTVPAFALPLAVASTTRRMDVSMGYNDTGFFLWSLDGISQRADYNSPVLLSASTGIGAAKMPGVPDYPAEWNVKNFGSNQTIRIHVVNTTPVAHPMHLHGHNMFILSEGEGIWDGVTINHAHNPQRRDVQMLRPNGYIVWQIDADNPGVWPFHCHIAWHASGGLYANILERPTEIANYFIPGLLGDIEGLMDQTCRAWNQYTGWNVPDQIDSGV